MGIIVNCMSAIIFPYIYILNRRFATKSAGKRIRATFQFLLLIIAGCAALTAVLIIAEGNKIEN